MKMKWILTGTIVLLHIAQLMAQPALIPWLDIQQIIDKEVQEGKKTITLPQGKYKVKPHDGCHLVLDGLEDVVINAENVEILCTETTRAIAVRNCKNVTIKGLTIDYDPLPFTQGRIIKLSEDKAIHTIQLFEGYPTADFIKESKYEIFRADTHTLRWGNYYDFEVRKLSDRLIEVEKLGVHRERKYEAVGDLIVIAAQHAPGGYQSHTVFSENSTQIAFEQVTLYSSPVFGFFETNCSGNTYLRCVIDRKPLDKELVSRQYPRIRSLNADAFHSKHATIGPSILECKARFQGDDCININGAYHLISEVRGSQLHVIAKIEMNLSANDEVEIFTYDGEVHTGVKVKDVSFLENVPAAMRQSFDTLDLNRNVKPRLIKVYKVELSRDDLNIEPGSIIASANKTGNGFKVLNCDFGFIRSRGILIKASEGVVSGNTIEAACMEAIKVAPEYHWLEAGNSSNIKIHNNTIINCQSAGITVYSMVGSGKIAGAGAHQNISIKNNRILNSPAPGIFITSTTGLSMENNTLELTDHETVNSLTFKRRFDLQKTKAIELHNVIEN